MKKIIWLLMFLPISLFAQKTHKVEPKESLYSIGRKYKVHPRELAEFNNISLSDGVKIGQVIKIPAKPKMEPLQDESSSANKSSINEKKDLKSEEDTNTNETKTSKKNKKENKKEDVSNVSNNKTESKTISNPIKHKVQKKETLYQISKKNNVSVEDIKKWNHLNADGVNEGVELIVGYEKAVPGLKESENMTDKNNEKSPSKKETKKVTAEDKSTTVKNDSVIIEDKSTTVKNDQKVISNQSNSEIKDYKGGYFAADYNHQMNEKSTPTEQKGVASAFKSTSGWDDGRYYCLYNSSPAGTIVKIQNPSNQKFIYAKVLDAIPDLKQNEGVVIIISKAASEQLSVTTDKFDVELSY